MDSKALFDVSGKVALVTGGSGGIGYMIAEGLLSAGCTVYIVSRKAAGLDAAADRLGALGTVVSIVADLATAEGVAAVADRIVGASPLNILVNNAGTTWGAPIDAFPRDGFDKVLKLNLLAPFDLTRALLPALRSGATQDDPARVVNIASIDGLRVPMWESYPYSATKAGLIHMSRHMGKFLAGEHISVNTIAPGFFPSRMSATIVDFDDPEELDRVASPLGARVGTTEDIAGAVIYLCSRAGAWLSGVTIPVGGGRGTIDN
ncbi:MAG: SDR family NAD(P)-dependent oxidoreductase [Sphingobium sp.]